MNAGSRGRGDLQTKEERDRGQDRHSLAPSRSRGWSAFRNPRIVRVSRTFGGKDRHSKVCTVQGLRDRRIRLSVPTAVQLYDLQERLGVSQPSKVIDWLIDATKHEIDRLPPLQMPPGFGLVCPKLLGAPFFDIGSSTTSAFLRQGFIDQLQLTKNEIGINENWNFNDLIRVRGKEVESRGSHHLQKAKFPEPSFPAQVDFFPLPNLSHHPGIQLGFNPQTDQNPFTNASSPSIMPRIFPPYNNGSTPHHPLAAENSFQLLSSGQPFSPPLHLFGPSTSRPISGEYVRLVTCPDNKIPKAHHTYDDNFDGVC